MIIRQEFRFSAFISWHLHLDVFQVFVQDIPNACAMALIVFPTFLSFKMAWFSPKDSSLVFMMVYHKCSLHRQNPRLKPRVDIQNYLLFSQSIEQDASGQQETPVSHMVQYFYFYTKGDKLFKKIPITFYIFWPQTQLSSAYSKTKEFTLLFW